MPCAVATVIVATKTSGRSPWPTAVVTAARSSTLAAGSRGSRRMTSYSSGRRAMLATALVATLASGAVLSAAAWVGHYGSDLVYRQGATAASLPSPGPREALATRSLTGSRPGARRWIEGVRSRNWPVDALARHG